MKRKIIPKLNKSKFDYEYYEDFEENVDDSPDCYLHFNIRNNIVNINIDWKSDFPVDDFISLLIPCATGEIIGAILHQLEAICEEDEVEYIKESLKEKLSERLNKETGLISDEEPLIPAVHTFDHLMNDNQVED